MIGICFVSSCVRTMECNNLCIRGPNIGAYVLSMAVSAPAGFAAHSPLSKFPSLHGYDNGGRYTITVHMLPN